MEDGDRWFNAVKIRLLAWAAVGLTVPLAAVSGGLFLSSINSQLTEIRDTQKLAAAAQSTTAGQVQTMQTNLAVVSTTITEGLVKSVQAANDVNAAQTQRLDNIQDRLGKAEGDLKVLQELQRMQLPSPGRK